MDVSDVKAGNGSREGEVTISQDWKMSTSNGKINRIKDLISAFFPAKKDWELFRPVLEKYTQILWGRPILRGYGYASDCGQSNLREGLKDHRKETGTDMFFPELNVMLQISSLPAISSEGSKTVC